MLIWSTNDLDGSDQAAFFPILVFNRYAVDRPVPIFCIFPAATTSRNIFRDGVSHMPKISENLAAEKLVNCTYLISSPSSKSETSK